MATNKKIQTTELDFDGIKQNLKTYLQGQSEFSDYDFDGSGLSILLDVLAYNTHYNALYTNLAINEAFLESASKRSSVVSKAKELGYTPNSAKCATAVVGVTFINNSLNAPSFAEIPRYSTFSSNINGSTYTFYTTESHVAQRSNNQYIFNNIEIKEGTYLEFRYTISAGTKIVIPNTNVDISTLRVYVQDDVESSTITTFNLADTIVNVGSTDPIYFIKELDNGLYEIEFGNGVVGKALSVGNIVDITYIVCNADAPNGAASFSYNGPLPGSSEAFVNTQTIAIGGGAAESIDSIKWNAPRMYAAQNRAVTADDYRVLINSMYPGIKSISVWGGESNNPPVYGKVFIAIVPNDGGVLEQADKDYILDDIINPRKALSVTPEFVDPEYIKIGLDVSFYYDPQMTTRNANDIASLVLQVLQDYNTTSLNTFGGVFKHSRLSTLIDQAEPSITSNITTVKLYKEIIPIFDTSATYNIQLSNPIYNSGVPEESISSTGFYCTDSEELCFIEDVPVPNSTTGNLALFYVNNSSQKIIVKTVGTVDYLSGTISIVNLTITGLLSTPLTVIIAPQSYDVVAARQQFAIIDFDFVTVTPVADISTQPYTFTSSRS